MPATENPTFSLEQFRENRTFRRPLTPEQQAECDELGRKIAWSVETLNLMGRSRYEEIPGGHLRTFTVGEEPTYDSDRKTHVKELTISVAETLSYRGKNGREEIFGKVAIRQYVPPLVHIDVKEHYPSGGVGGTGWAEKPTPEELKAVLHVLTEGSDRDPRNLNWNAEEPSISQSHS